MRVVVWLLLLIPIGMAGLAWDRWAPEDAGSLWLALLAITFSLGLYARDRMDVDDRVAIMIAAICVLGWRVAHLFIPGLWG